MVPPFLPSYKNTARSLVWAVSLRKIGSPLLIFIMFPLYTIASGATKTKITGQKRSCYREMRKEPFPDRESFTFRVIKNNSIMIIWNRKVGSFLLGRSRLSNRHSRMSKILFQEIIRADHIVPRRISCQFANKKTIVIIHLCQ